MYNLPFRARVAPAGSVRPQYGIGARAPPAAASQVTPSHALAMFEDTVPETVMSGDESDEMFDNNVRVVEARHRLLSHTQCLSRQTFHLCSVMLVVMRFIKV